jgi:hypothetical protein
MTLGEVVEKLSELGSEDTIYAAEPWTEQSEAIVAREPDTGVEVSAAGMKYFLEVGIARDFVADWLATMKQQPTHSAICRRLISYAINDA